MTSKATKYLLDQSIDYLEVLDEKYDKDDLEDALEFSPDEWDNAMTEVVRILTEAK